jgi:hypothetical protein
MPSNIKIPKVIAGVKLPRKVRKKAKKAIKENAGPIVREFASAALGAAAARARQHGPGPARVETRIHHVDGNKVAEAIRAAALNGLRSFLEGLDQGLRDLDAAPAAPKRAKPAGKPKRPKPKAMPAGAAP